MNTIIRTTATHIATVAHRLALIGVQVDGDEPADQTPSAFRIRVPDMVDDGQAYWFGPDAVVGCDSKLVLRIGQIVDVGSYKARRGISPESLGITVTPFLDGYHNVSNDAHGKNARLYDLWALAAETVLADDEDAVVVAIARRRSILRRRAA